MLDGTHRKFAIALAREAGGIIRDTLALKTKKKLKTDGVLAGTLVTQTDITINALVMRSVKKAFPEHGVLAEEGSDVSAGNEYVWVCDPLDGTNQFAYSVPLCTFSLALTTQGESMLGVVYDPFTDRMFSAEKGRGAFMNKERLSVSPAQTFKDAHFGLAWWRDAQYDFSGLAEAFKQKGARVMQNFSIAYMGALVAGGAFDGAVFPGKYPYDSAAVKVIVEEAGGKVTDIFGNKQRYDRPIKGHIASNRILHEKLLALVQETLKK